MSELRIRPATLADVPVIVHQRRAMFNDMQVSDAARLDAHDAGVELWLRRKLPEGEYHGWLVENGRGEVIAGAGLWLMDWPPHPDDPTARRGCVMNVYVEPAYRRQGIARRLMGMLIGWCRDDGVRFVLLHPSDKGKPLYESLGFEVSGDMVLSLSDG
jgi:GNAT superfamily N-acetyltransferase